MLRFAFLILLGLPFEAAVAAPCTTLAAAQAAAAKGSPLSHQALDRRQFFWLRGFFDGNPSAPDAPDADGAILFMRDEAPESGGIVIWTRGVLACAPTPVSEPIVKKLAAIRAAGRAAGEGDSL